MKIEQTPLEGLVLIHPRVFTDSRGFFFETYREDEFRGLGIGRACLHDNHAMWVRGVVRGLQFRRGHDQAKLVCSVAGAVWDVAVALRTGLPTLGRWFATELSAENKAMLLVP